MLNKTSSPRGIVRLIKDQSMAIYMWGRILLEWSHILICFRQSVYVNSPQVFINIIHFIAKSFPLWKINYMVTIEWKEYRNWNQRDLRLNTVFVFYCLWLRASFSSYKAISPKVTRLLWGENEGFIKCFALPSLAPGD